MTDALDAKSLEDLVAECAGRVESEGRAVLAQLCREHPAHADALRHAIEQLARFGVVGPANERSPQQLGDFEIRGELGRGGMGVVYEARQRSLGRIVALKVLPAAWVVDARQVQRFKNEAQAAATLDHPGIVPIYLVGAEGDVHYYAMQLIRGVSVSRVLQWLRGERPPADPRTESVVHGLFPPQSDEAVVEGPAPVRRAACGPSYGRRMAMLALQAAEALDAAHRVGVLHRDIKPGNLLVDSRGQLWVTDFGLAHFVQGGSSLTRPGELVGTLCYSSPEQVGGRTAVDARSDVYGLGATLYEMLTLRQPFTAADHVALLRLVATEEPEAPRALHPGIPRDLETIVLRAMAKEPARRYASAAALASDLRAFLAGRPIVARPVTRIERAWLWCQRNRALAGAVFGLVLLAMFAAGVGFFGWRASRERDRALRAEAKLTQISSRLRIESNRAAADALRRSLQPGRRFASLRLLRDVIPELAAGAATAADAAALRVQLRSEVVASLSRWDATMEQILAAEQAEPLAFDGAFARNIALHDGGVVVRESSGKEVARLRLPMPPIFARFAADGEWIALLGSNGATLSAWHWRSGRMIELPPLVPDARAFAFTGDGARLVAGLADRRIVACDLATGACTDLLGPRAREHLGSRYAACFLALRPDGRGIALSGANLSHVLCVDLDTDQVRRIDVPDDVCALAWQADARHLVVGGRFMDVLQLDTESGAVVGTWRGHGGTVIEMANRERGDLLASGWYDGQVRLWLPTGEPLLVLPVADRIYDLMFTADGARLGWTRALSATGSFTGALCWRLHPPETVCVHRIDRLRQAGLPLVALCPTAPLLAATMEDSVVLLHAASGELLGQIPFAGSRCVRFLPDGALFLAGGPGAQVYPLARSDDAIRLGPPRQITATGEIAEATTDGERVAVWDRREMRVISCAGAEPSRRIAADFPRGAHLRLAPRLPYAALGSWGGRGVIVWDITTGAVATEVPGWEHTAFPCFSPDGRHLVVSRRDAQWVVEVGSWRHVHTIAKPSLQGVPGAAAFAADGSLLVVATNRYRVQLVDGHTFAPLLELETPNDDEVGIFEFSSDGTRLAMASAHRSIVMWDLRAMRIALREVGLDWSDQPIPPLPRDEPLRLVIQQR